VGILWPQLSQVTQYLVMEETIIRLRADASLKKAFEQACKVRDQSMSQVLRQFMRHYVAQTIKGQHDLFEQDHEEPHSNAVLLPTR
jgi:hypothetical protein